MSNEKDKTENDANLSETGSSTSETVGKDLGDKDLKATKQKLAEEEQQKLEEEAAEEEARRRRAAAIEAGKRRSAAAEAARAIEASLKAAESQKANALAQQKQKMERKPSVIFSQEPLRPKPTPGATPKPEPDYIKQFKNKLKDEEEKNSVHFNSETGQLIFSGAKGLDAMFRFLEQNPDVQITLVTDRAMLKDALRELRDRTFTDKSNLLDRLDAIELEGIPLRGNEMRKIINDKIGPPTLYPTTGMQGEG